MMDENPDICVHTVSQNSIGHFFSLRQQQKEPRVSLEQFEMAKITVETSLNRQSIVQSYTFVEKNWTETSCRTNSNGFI